MMANAGEAEARQASSQEAAVEILMLNVLDQPNDVQIVFRIQDPNQGGQVLIHRFQYDEFDNFTPDTIAQVEVGDLQPFLDLEGYENVFHYDDLGVPAHIDPPYHYYLALDVDGTGDKFSDIHASIELRETSFDACDRMVILQWGAYKIFDFFWQEKDLPFSHYQILVDGQQVDSVSIEETSHAVSLDQPGEYIFRVKAMQYDDNGHSGPYSHSNSLEESFFWPTLNTLTLTKVDVLDDSTVQLMALADGDHEDYVFRFERKREEGDFLGLEEGLSGPSQTEFSFFDGDVDGLDEAPWIYRTRAHLLYQGDECPEPAQVSEAVSTLWLGLEVSVQTSDQLILEFDFLRFPDASRYDLEQILPGESEFAILASDVSRPYIHDFSSLLPMAGELSFRIKGEPGPSSFHSNVVYLYFEPEVVIPNAFRPASNNPENQVFKPRFIGFSPTYSLQVYDRNGLQVFASSPADISPEWDGTILGNPAPDGAYVYRLQYSSPMNNADPIEKSGVVYLVR